jgi:hypothetical protein
VHEFCELVMASGGFGMNANVDDDGIGCGVVQCGSAREQVHSAEAGDGNSGGQEHGFPGSAATSADADDGCVRQLCDPKGRRGCGDQGWDCVDNLGCGSAGGWVLLTRELILVAVAVRCDAVGGRGWEADVLC